MDIFKLNPELVGILLFLAPGYLGFRLYQIDRGWSDLNAIDVIYGSLIFSTVAYATYLGMVAVGWGDYPARRVISLILFAVIYAFLWRRFGHDLFHQGLHALGVTNEDNKSTTWTQIFNNPKIYLTQITVEMKGGSQIWCENTLQFRRDEFRRVGIHPYYSDADGNLYLISTHSRSAQSGEWEPAPDVVSDWGVNLVFVPASEIARIDVRAIRSANAGAAEDPKAAL